MKSLSHFLLIAMGCAALMQTPLCAGTIVSGALTGTAIFDLATDSFVAFDVRGNAVMDTGSGLVKIVDTLASPTFGNTQLVVVDQPDDGSSLFLNFDPLTLALSFPYVTVNANSAIALGSPSPAELVLLGGPQSFQFLTIGVSQFTETQFALTLLDAAAVPEPVGFSLVGLGLISLVVLGRRRTFVKR